MRLISQTGDVDIPYETTSLSRTGNIIRAYVQMISVVMACYSTDEKIKKVIF